MPPAYVHGIAWGVERMRTAQGWHVMLREVCSSDVIGSVKNLDAPLSGDWRCCTITSTFWPPPRRRWRPATDWENYIAKHSFVALVVRTYSDRPTWLIDGSQLGNMPLCDRCASTSQYTPSEVSTLWRDWNGYCHQPSAGSHFSSSLSSSSSSRKFIRHPLQGLSGAVQYSVSRIGLHKVVFVRLMITIILYLFSAHGHDYKQ